METLLACRSSQLAVFYCSRLCFGTVYEDSSKRIDLQIASPSSYCVPHVEVVNNLQCTGQAAINVLTQ